MVDERVTVEDVEKLVGTLWEAVLAAELPKGVETRIEGSVTSIRSYLAVIEAAKVTDEAEQEFNDIYNVVVWSEAVDISINSKTVEDASPLLKWLAKKGWHLRSKPYNSKTDMVRTYKLFNKEVGQSINIRQSFIEGDGACRFVMTGEMQRSYTETTYELRCPKEGVIE